MLDFLPKLRKIKNFNHRVYEIMRHIPSGKVMTYGQIALLTGNAHASRAVGYALHQIAEEDNLPWQRVVFKDGSLAFALTQYNLLKAEGIRFDQERKVKMSQHLWLSNAEIETILWFN